MTGPAFAADADAADGEGDIIVTGRSEGYRTIETTSGTKTATPLLDVPQAIAVVTAQQIADQQIRSMADLVRLTPGLSAGQGEGHRDQITIRGNNSTADFFVDGLRDDVQYYRPFYNIERVEVHKGPNAMVFGRGGGGGLINRITKGALADTSLYAGSLSIDSFGAAYGAVDINTPLAPGAALRVNGFYESLANHRDGFEGDRYAINPVIGAQLSDRVSVQLGYEYVRDDRVVDRGIPSAFTGTATNPAGPAAGVRDTLFTDPAIARARFEAHVLSFRGQAALTDSLTLSAQALYGDYDKLYTNVLAATAVRTATSGALTGQQVIGIEAYRDPTRRQSFIGQINAEWRGSTGPIDHILLVGGEFTAQDTDNERINGFWNANVLTSAGRRTDIIFRDAPTIPPVFFIAGPTGNSNRAVRSNLDQWSAYVQDQISLTDSIDVIAGLRYDRFDLAVTNLFNNATDRRVDNLWSPRLGVVVKPVPQASLYASWTRSYLPQSGDQFLSLDATAATLSPEQFDNYELGAKWVITPSLTASLAIFQLDRSNTRANGPVAGTVVLTGAQRTKGVELALVGQIMRHWQASFGYARLEADITATTSAAPSGRIVPQVPRDQLSLWNRVTLNRWLGVGLGLYHQSSSFAAISNATRLPAYTRVDAALYATIADGVDVQLNVENLLGEDYYPVAHNDNNISTGAPTNARLTVNFRF